MMVSDSLLMICFLLFLNNTLVIIKRRSKVLLLLLSTRKTAVISYTSFFIKPKKMTKQRHFPPTAIFLNSVTVCNLSFSHQIQKLKKLQIQDSESDLTNGQESGIFLVVQLPPQRKSVFLAQISVSLLWPEFQCKEKSCSSHPALHIPLWWTIFCWFWNWMNWIIYIISGLVV